jgi:hypothetical protein
VVEGNGGFTNIFEALTNICRKMVSIGEKSGEPSDDSAERELNDG